MDRTDRPVTPEEEGRLSELFEALTPPLEDEGFSALVVRRIRRRALVAARGTWHGRGRRRRAGARPALPTVRPDLRTVRPDLRGARPAVRGPGYGGHELERPGLAGSEPVDPDHGSSGRVHSRSDSAIGQIAIDADPPTCADLADDFVGSVASGQAIPLLIP